MSRSIAQSIASAALPTVRGCRFYSVRQLEWCGSERNGPCPLHEDAMSGLVAYLNNATIVECEHLGVCHTHKEADRGVPDLPISPIVFTSAPDGADASTLPMASCVGEGMRLSVIRDAGERAFVAKYRRSALGVFDAVVNNVARSDIARLLHLYVEGGFYVDRDYVCFRPLNASEWRPNAMYMAPQFHPNCSESKYKRDAAWSRSKFANAFFASSRGHPFLSHALRQIERLLDRRTKTRNVAELTGPRPLTTAWRTYNQIEGPVRLLDFCDVYGVEWFKTHPCSDLRPSALTECASHFPLTAIGTHMWNHSWIKNPRRPTHVDCPSKCSRPTP